MIPFLRDFVQEVAAAIELPDPIVEFGALQVEESQDIDLRPLFPGRAYVGTDFRAGPGVDRVEDLRGLTFADGEVGTAICLETLEHVADPMTAGRELARVVAPGGVALVSTPFLLGIHGYPNDYFRYTPEGLREVLAGFDEVQTVGIGDQGAPQHVLALAANGRDLGLDVTGLACIRSVQARFDRADGLVRIGPMRLPPKEALRTVTGELWRIARRR